MATTDSTIDAESGDPFTLTPSSPPKTPHRADSSLSTSFTNGSPSQARRALEAHIADTDRRIRAASKLGTSLLEQKKQLSDRLIESQFQTQQGANEIGPELKQKLAELDREYNDLGRDSARSLLSTTRTNGDAANGASVFSSERSASPSKPAAPPSTSNRKSRNMSSRVEDLTFATEISTSLLGQVRHLQNVLAEKEDALRQANTDNSRLQEDSDGMHARLKAYDDNEQRYKDENWQLDTQVQELAAQLQETTSRHQRLEQNLQSIQTEKSNMERDGDHMRLAHGKLSEDHAALRKKHDTELANLRRSITTTETDKDLMQKKIQELTSQNEELAQAVAHRMRSEAEQQPPGAFLDSEEDDRDHTTPEPSPPASPVKGTPRHGALESETLKSSLHHAHRMIQNLKNNIHREKTEKLELRRMLQDARDEVETRRADSGMVNRNKSRKQTSDKDLFKKPARPARLGAGQNASEEVINDPSWEEYDGSPTRQMQHRRIEPQDSSTDASDAFETANEAESTDAFETAESVMGDDTEGDETETEATIGTRPSTQRPTRISHMPAGSRDSFLSTASDEDQFDLTTPPRNDRGPYKLRMNRDRLRQSSATPIAQDSPASFVSTSSRSSDVTAKHDLAAELEDMDEGSSIADSTPSRSIFSSSFRSSPDDQRKSETRIRIDDEPVITRPQMVDSGMLTEPWQPGPIKSSEAGLLGAVAGMGTAGLVALGLRSDNDDEPEKVTTEAGRSITDVGGDAESHPETPPKRAYVDQGYQPSPAAMSATSREPADVHPQTAVADSKPTSFGFSSLRIQDTRPTSTIESFSQTSKERPLTMLSSLGPASTRTSAISESFGQELSAFPAPPSHDVPVWPKTVTSVPLSFSSIKSQNIAPIPSSLSSAQSIAMDASMAGVLPKGINPSVPASDSAAVPYKPAPSMAFVDRIVNDSSWIKAKPSVPVASDRPRTPTMISRKLPNRDLSVDDVFVSESARTSPSGNENTDSSSSGPVVNQDGRVPLAPVSGNNSPTKISSTSFSPAVMKTEGTQTMVSSAEIERMMREKAAQPVPVVIPNFSSPIRPGSSSRGRTTEMIPPELTQRSPRRVSSSSVNRTGTTNAPTVMAPPLPLDHREVIAAASRTSSLQGGIAPPNFGPSGLRSSPSQQLRPQTSSSAFDRGANAQSSTNFSSTPTQQRYRAPSIQPSRDGALTRQTSVSSFASEVDERFAVPTSAFMEYDPTTADPRMIQAITQTMIGEFMWKYTRKTGSSSTQSSNRHKRFFWIHPYTRTLYWSVQDPSRLGSSRTELKAKSVPIEAVRVVTDTNPTPPGLWQKSIIILTPGKGRSIKFTAPTGMRHETWFNALSYLLLRNNASDRIDDTSDQATSAAYASMRSSRTSNAHKNSSMRGSTTTVNTRRNYTDNSPASKDQSSTGAGFDRSHTLSSLTDQEISEFNPTLHVHGRNNSRMTGSTSYRSLRSNNNASTSSPRKSNQANTGSLGHSQHPSTATTTGSSIPTSPVAGRAQPARSLAAVGASTAAAPHTLAGATMLAGTNPMFPTTEQQQTRDGAGEFDADGFRKPARPLRASESVSTTTSQNQNQAQSTDQNHFSAARTSRLGSMTSRMGSMFHRSRSMSRAPTSTSTFGGAGQGHQDGAPRLETADSSVPSVDSSSTAVAGNESLGMVTPRQSDEHHHQRPGSRNGSGSGTVENVRACCDGMSFSVFSSDHRFPLSLS